MEPDLGQQCAQGTGVGDKKLHTPAGAMADVVEEAVKKASPRDVGLFLKMIGVGIFLVSLGIAVSFVLRGSISVSAKADAKISADDLGKMKSEAVEARKPLKIEQTIEGAPAGATITKTVTLPKD